MVTIAKKTDKNKKAIARFVLHPALDVKPQILQLTFSFEAVLLEAIQPCKQAYPQAGKQL